MTESKVMTRQGMHTITPHIVVSDAAAAADWYCGRRKRERAAAGGRNRWTHPYDRLLLAKLDVADRAQTRFMARAAGLGDTTT
jgi:hypothetical protein